MQKQHRRAPKNPPVVIDAFQERIAPALFSLEAD